MNVEAGEGAITEFWPQCQNEVINGLYPLRRLLNGSDHSAVFTTECAAQGLDTAAVKIVPVERVTLAQLAHWRTVAAQSHPHLIRLLDTGLCQLGGRQFVFVVMEYADQTLAQVLLQRALTADEVQDMLPPALDALAFLHCTNLVQGQLKPANILVVGDQVKLASDTVRPAGEPRMSVAKLSAYDPPEAENARLSAAGDIWALGITMVEALTQRLPASSNAQSVADCLPATLAPAFADTIQRCLSQDPADRPTAGEMQAQYQRAPQPADIALAPAVVSGAPGRTDPSNKPARRGPALTIATILIVLGATWVGLRMYQSRSHARQLTAATVQPAPRQSAGDPPASQALETPASSVPAVSAPPASAKSRKAEPTPPRPVARQKTQPTAPPEDASPSVVHEEIPIAPLSARETIHGHVKVAVRVIVDPSGAVVDALLENPGPSAYFARLAKDAAKKWTFAAVDGQDSREWILRFEFGRDRATAHAATQQP